MKKVIVIIEKGEDGTYGVHIQGKPVAKKCFPLDQQFENIFRFFSELKQ